MSIMESLSNIASGGGSILSRGGGNCSRKSSSDSIGFGGGGGGGGGGFRFCAIMALLLGETESGVAQDEVLYGVEFVDTEKRP